MRRSDHHALNLIRTGRIIADPTTGVVLVDGTPRGSNAGGYQRIHCAGLAMMVHRVIWLWVHGSIPDGHVINHRDGNRRNNRITNLEAITQAQNVLHATATMTRSGVIVDSPSPICDRQTRSGGMSASRSPQRQTGAGASS